MTTYLTPQTEYDVKARRISGTRAEKLEEIDAAMQELLDIKTLECLSERPNVQFLAVRKPRSHAFAMTVTLLVLVILLVLLLGVRASHAQTTDPQPEAPDFNNLKSSQFSAIVKSMPALTWTTSYCFARGRPDDGLPNWIGNKTGAW